MVENIKCVVFDIGQTLAYYPIPLNWSKLYRPAFESVADKLGLSISEAEYTHIGEVLSKYNARIVPREVEVSSDQIFTEILEGTAIPSELIAEIKKGFYSFFRREVVVYPEAEEVLAELKRRGVATATLSDVAYGMDNEFALEDIRPLMKYIDLPYTSNDIGMRKPAPDGLLKIAGKFGVKPCEVAFVGDEPKDMECALRAGITGILIDREDRPLKGETSAAIVIHDLRELLLLTEKM